MDSLQSKLNCRRATQNFLRSPLMLNSDCGTRVGTQYRQVSFGIANECQRGGPRSTPFETPAYGRMHRQHDANGLECARIGANPLSFCLRIRRMLQSVRMISHKFFYLSILYDLREMLPNLRAHKITGA